MRGVAGLPEASEINGCDNPAAVQNPAKTAGNLGECCTFPCVEPSRPITGWGATEKPGPGLRLWQALAPADLRGGAAPGAPAPRLASCSGRRYQNVPQAAPRHYGRTHRRRRDLPVTLDGTLLTKRPDDRPCAATKGFRLAKFDRATPPGLRLGVGACFTPPPDVPWTSCCHGIGKRPMSHWRHNLNHAPGYGRRIDDGCASRACAEQSRQNVEALLADLGSLSRQSTAQSRLCTNTRSSQRSNFRPTSL
jgi:hypothetical protein